MNILSKHVGNTPFIKLHKSLFAKYEVYNPTGTIKDRTIIYIINFAEKYGLIKKGDTIVEVSSGNAGTTLAMLGAERGYNIKIIMPQNISERKKILIKAFGAEIFEVGEDDYDSARLLRSQMVKKYGWFTPDQHYNKLNIECHKNTTGAEIIKNAKKIHKTIDAIILGSGTGGTIMGVRQSLIKVFPNIKTIVAEPLMKDERRRAKDYFGFEGIGQSEKFLLEKKYVDEYIMVNFEDAKKTCRQLALSKGLFTSIISGANVFAAEKWIMENCPQNIVVTIIGENGERNLEIYK